MFPDPPPLHVCGRYLTPGIALDHCRLLSQKGPAGPGLRPCEGFAGQGPALSRLGFFAAEEGLGNLVVRPSGVNTGIVSTRTGGVLEPKSDFRTVPIFWNKIVGFSHLQYPTSYIFTESVRNRYGIPYRFRKF